MMIPISGLERKETKKITVIACETLEISIKEEYTPWDSKQATEIAKDVLLSKE